MIYEISITGRHPDTTPEPSFAIRLDHETGRFSFVIGVEETGEQTTIEVNSDDAREILYEGLRLVNEQISSLAVKKDF